MREPTVNVMNVIEIMTRDVARCREGDSLLDAVRLMSERDCGCVPVVAEDGRVVGIVTDRDACVAELRTRMVGAGQPASTFVVESRLSVGCAAART